MEGKVLKQKLMKKSLLSSTFLLTFSLVMIMTLSACEKSSSDDEGMDWKGVLVIRNQDMVGHPIILTAICPVNFLLCYNIVL